LVDEVGKMECFSAAFCAAVERLLGTIALRGSAFVQVVRGQPDVELVEVTPANREELVGEVVLSLGR
jgi:nucleoside-triphosphatase